MQGARRYECSMHIVQLYLYAVNKSIRPYYNPVHRKVYGVYVKNRSSKIEFLFVQ